MTSSEYGTGDYGTGRTEADMGTEAEGQRDTGPNAAGADPMTFAGLAGLGDVVATCSSRLSRNRYVGEQLAKGRSWPEIRDSMDNVAEGVNATRAALILAKELGVEMPIAEMASRVLFDGLSPQKAMAELMSRPARSEW